MLALAPLDRTVCRAAFQSNPSGAETESSFTKAAGGSIRHWQTPRNNAVNIAPRQRLNYTTTLCTRTHARTHAQQAPLASCLRHRKGLGQVLPKTIISLTKYLKLVRTSQPQAPCRVPFVFKGLLFHSWTQNDAKPTYSIHLPMFCRSYVVPQQRVVGLQLAISAVKAKQSGGKLEA